MMINRQLIETLQKSRKNVLLLGPRQTGKSTLIQSLAPDVTINLAHEPTFLEFARNPAELEQRLAAGTPHSIFIDEIQRLPSMLNTIQSLVDAHPTQYRFLLTGSSARKLRRGNANLLPGRIHSYHLGPLSCMELNYALNTEQAMSTGTLPGIYTDTVPADREKTLHTYGATYLKEEIQAESLTRNLEGFSRFLFLVAECSGQWLDLSKLSSEAGITRQSAIRYFEVLEDTLIVNRCNAFSKSSRKRLVQHPKFYFFDTGVLNGLLANFTASADRKRVLFEHLFFNQLMSSAAAKDVELRISLYRTEHGAEVDFIVEKGKDIWAVELKASINVGTNDLRGFASFSAFYRHPFRACVAYTGTIRKRLGDVDVYPWQDLLREMGL